jgi:HAD superfamily hydrolase (TIGR01509 family)
MCQYRRRDLVPCAVRLRLTVHCGLINAVPRSGLSAAAVGCHHSLVIFGDWTPRAVVFDCDGLLVDTEPCWTVAETELFARRGLPFGPDEKKLLIGRSLPVAGEFLSGHFDEPGRGPQIADELESLVLDVLAAQAEAMPGARTVVELAAARVPVAVASNSSRRLLDLALHRTGLDRVFEVSLAADEVEQPKPAPEMYERACERLGVPAADALAFEDSLTGMRSAVAAGLRLICVPTFDQPDLPGDWRLPSLDHDGLLAWIRTWPDRTATGQAGVHPQWT